MGSLSFTSSDFTPPVSRPFSAVSSFSENRGGGGGMIGSTVSSGGRGRRKGSVVMLDRGAFDHASSSFVGGEIPTTAVLPDVTNARKSDVDRTKRQDSGFLSVGHTSEGRVATSGRIRPHSSLAGREMLDPAGVVSRSVHVSKRPQTALGR